VVEGQVLALLIVFFLCEISVFSVSLWLKGFEEIGPARCYIRILNTEATRDTEISLRLVHFQHEVIEVKGTNFYSLFKAFVIPFTTNGSMIL
jgi:hypothetical protein